MGRFYCARLQTTALAKKKALSFWFHNELHFVFSHLFIGSAFTFVAFFFRKIKEKTLQEENENRLKSKQPRIRCIVALYNKISLKKWDKNTRVARSDTDLWAVAKNKIDLMNLPESFQEPTRELFFRSVRDCRPTVLFQTGLFSSFSLCLLN